MTEFLTQAGYHSNGFWMNFGYGSTLAMDSFLGLAHIVDDGSNPGFNLTPFLTPAPEPLPAGAFACYDNPGALPLAFGVAATAPAEPVVCWGSDTYTGPAAAPLVYWYDYFEWQNAYFQSLRPELQNGDGSALDVFDRIGFAYEGDDSSGYVDPVGLAGTVRGSGVVRTRVNTWASGTGATRALPTFDVTAGGSLAYTFVSDGTRPVYWYFKDLAVAAADVSFTMDGTRIENLSYWHNGIVSFKPGAGTHVLRVAFAKDQSGLEVRDGIYAENPAAWAAFAAAFRADSVNGTLIEHTPSRLTGQVTFTAARARLLVTLPLEAGLRVYVDGRRLALARTGRIFASADVSGFAPGVHDIAIVYVDSGFWAGIAVASLTMGLWAWGGVWQALAPGAGHGWRTRRAFCYDRGPGGKRGRGA